jgi:D-serine deaminase-like pyridoxal phosphate-dependent protein
MLEIAKDPARLRPHVKTHKLGPLVQRQVALGIVKFKCSTIAEAEMVAEGGGEDVLLAYPCVGPNTARLCALASAFPHVRFGTVADAGEPVRALGQIAERCGVTLDLYVDIDCGMHRTGIAPDSRAAELFREIEKTRGVRAAGLHAYDGHLVESDPTLREAQCEAAFEPVLALQRELGAHPLIAGGSPTFPIHAAHAERELSPGTTVLWDFGYAEKFPDLPFEPAAILLTRVVSKPAPNRLCLDLGHKAVAAESPPPRVQLLEIPDALAVMHSEEHLVVETAHADEFPIGAAIHGIPRHVCPTVALHSEAWWVEGGVARERWPILARARRLSL